MSINWASVPLESGTVECGDAIAASVSGDLCEEFSGERAKVRAELFDRETRETGPISWR